MKCLDVGATACIVFLTEEEDELSGFKKKKKFLYCSFLGDVHCIVISKTKANKLTKTHNIENIDEKKRIENIGGVIYDEKIYGQENLTRAFGMFNLKQYGIKNLQFESNKKHITNVRLLNLIVHKLQKQYSRKNETRM